MTLRTLPPLTEKQFLAQVRELAVLGGFRVYHAWLSVRSQPGWPDLTLVKPGRLVFAELKVGSRPLTSTQAQWLEILRDSIPGVEVYCWTPEMWDDIEAILLAK